MLATMATQRLFALFSIFSAVYALTLLKPPGPFDIYYNTVKMVDKTRIDSFDPQKGHRAVMTSILIPTHCPVNLQTSNYLPSKTAAFYSKQFAAYGIPKDTLGSIQLQVCPTKPSPRYRPRLGIEAEPPIVIFSPAQGTSRHFYGLMAQAVASFGYIVISINHPYDAEILEYPDGSTVLAASLTDAQIPLDVLTRAGDVRFVLDQLGSLLSMKQYAPQGTCSSAKPKVAMFGHSLGGAAAAQAMLHDNRIVGGINLDSSFYGPVVQKGLNRPFLIFGHENKTQSTDRSWEETWSNLRGWKLQLGLTKSQHYTFSDLPALLNLLGVPREVLEAAAGRLGTLDGLRGLEIVQTYVVAFLDFVLRRKSPVLLQRPVASFPEVSFIDQ